MKARALINRFAIVRLFSLHADQADDAAIDAAIRDNAQLGGTNLWVLMFAIVIASVGLNVNSTAVIIGAMLISPLMGPIIGIGYGAAVHDYAFIRQCFRNLALFVGISLFASTLYFLLTPLKIAHSELFARTSPNLWDVLIAFFGGAAGMVGLTRKEKNTIIPGVAIATALMPPICTAGFGMATGQLPFLLGALYLFLINAVFIALATLALARILRLPEHSFPDEATRRRGHQVIGGAVLLTLVPSVYLAYGLVKEEVFTVRAKRVVQEAVAQRDDIAVVRTAIDPKQRTIALTVLGKGVTAGLQQELDARLAGAGLKDARLSLRHPAEDRVDLSQLREQIRKDAMQSVVAVTEQSKQRVAELEGRVTRIDAVFSELARVENEIRLLVPGARRVKATTASLGGADGAAKLALLVVIDSRNKLSRAETERLQRWLKARVPQAAEIRVVAGRIEA